MEANFIKQPQAICQLARMGDLAQMVPLVEILAEHGPLTLYCDAVVMDWAKQIPGITGIISVDTCRWREIAAGSDLHLPELLEELAGELPVNASLQRLYALNDHPVCDAIASLVCGSALEKWWDVRLILMRSYLRAIGVDRSFSVLHLADLWRFLTPDPPPPRTPRINPGDVGMQFAYRTLQGLRQAGSRRIFAFILGSGGKYRRLTPEFFSAIWKQIQQRLPCGLILIGGKGETDLAEGFLKNAFPNTHTVVNLVGKCSAEELLGVFRISDLVVGVDTGPLHWATLAGSRVLGMYFGEAGYRETGPYGDSHLVLSPRCPEYPCGAVRARDCGYLCLRDFEKPAALAEIMLQAAERAEDRRMPVPQNLLLSSSSLDADGVSYSSFDAEEDASTAKSYRKRVKEIIALKSSPSRTVAPRFWDSFIDLWIEQVRSLRLPAANGKDKASRRKSEAMRILKYSRQTSRMQASEPEISAGASCASSS